MPVAFGGRLRNPPGKKWWEMTDAEKLATLEGAGEFVGGTVGSLAGGPTPMAIPGAGAGAVAGKNIANWIGRAAGLKQTPRTAGNEAIEQAKTFGLNAGFEGAGRVIPPAYRAVKQGATNVVRKALQPDAERHILVDLADKYNIPLNIAQRSGNTILAKFQGAIERLPFSSSVMRKAYREQYGKWLEGMNSVLDQVHKGAVTQEQFAELAEQGIRSLRNELNKTTTEAVERAATQLHPVPVSKQTAGLAAKDKLAENQNTVRAWAKKAYGAIRDEGKGVEVDLTPMSEQAQEVLQTFPDMPLRNSVFDQGSMGKLRSAASITSSGGEMETLDALAKSMGADSFSALNPKLQEMVRAQAAGEAKQSTAVTLEQALNTRSRLLNLARGMNDSASAEKKRAIYSLIDGLDNSLEQSLGATPETAALHQKLKDTNAVYRKKMEALRPPQTYGKPGNEAAGRIAQTDLPENIPTQLAQSPTLAQGSQKALSNEIVSDIGKPSGPPALPMLRRSIVDDATQRSMVDTGTGEMRLSPTRIAENLKQYGGELFGSPLPPSLRMRPQGGAAQPYGAAWQPPELLPDLARQEGRLYGSPTTRAIDSGKSNQVMEAMFPAGAPKTARASLDLMQEAGVRPQAQRAFGGALLDKAKTESKALGDERFVNPRTLDRFQEDYRETIPAVLGSNVADQLSKLNKVGRAITLDEVFNTSGTAQALEALQTAKGIPSAMAAGALALGKYAAETTGIPYLAAKKFTDPNLARRLTLPPKPVSLKLGSPAAGAVGRILGTSQREQSQSTSQQEPLEEWTPPVAAQSEPLEEWVPPGQRKQ